MKMKFLIATIVTSLLLTQWVYAAPEQIHFATEATYPPFEYIDNTGKMRGFDIEIAQALCDNMKAQCTFSNQAFNSLLPSLQLGKFDALVAAMGVTPEREQQVAFTQSYYEPSASFIAAKNDHYTIAALSGKIIGVQAGTTFEKYLETQFQNKITVSTYASVQDAFLDLTSGRLDVVLADTAIAVAWLGQENHADQFGIVDAPIVNRTYFGSGYAIAVRKDNAALLHKLNAALAAIKQNGTYAKITKKYFNMS